MSGKKGAVTGGAIGTAAGASTGCAVDANCTKAKDAKVKDAKAAREKLVQELVTILSETKSVETYFVTVSALGMMGRDARPAVPAIIRHAERLEIFKDISFDDSEKPNRQQRIAEGIMDSLEQILSKQPVAPPQVSYQVTPAMCPPPPGMVLPTPVSFPIMPPAPPPPNALPCRPTAPQMPNAE
jgi:hypothetical protein